jgi:hypothetical protein
MARIRTIKPEFPQSESMGRVSRDARLLFILIWTIADDAGRTRAASRMLASLLYPYDDGVDGHVETTAADIERWLDELDQEGCVRRYSFNGSTYLQVCNWLNHQKIDKPSRSRLPEFDESSRILANPREASSGDLGPRTKDQELSDASHPHPDADAPGPRADLTAGFPEFWQAYPRKESKAAALKVWKARRIGTDPELAERIRQDVAKRSREHRAWLDGFVPHAATYLRNERWTDTIDTRGNGNKPAPRENLQQRVTRLNGLEHLFPDMAPEAIEHGSAATSGIVGSDGRDLRAPVDGGNGRDPESGTSRRLVGTGVADT